MRSMLSSLYFLNPSKRTMLLVVRRCLPRRPSTPCVHSFWKTLTASSDTSTHGGFSVLRRHADKCLACSTGHEPSSSYTRAGCQGST